ncbi:phosphatidate cytidylyltransferase [Candidatus Pelagibacter sp.]|uniref:phosphatidate cytidylyltransferase n=1 Tax=Candidatus Pelagibacter sp. TaxID=2024849 RepID=UPI003F854A69
MKNKELSKRILTSSILIALLVLMLNYSFVLVGSLILIFVFTWIEFNGMIDKIIKDKNFSIKKNIFQSLIFIHLIFFSKIIIDEHIENLPNISWSLLFVIIICILTDIGGFIFGKIFKGKKLTKISPNKTYAGAIGSLFLTLVFSIIYSFSLSLTDLKVIIFISILISLISQIGDLFISYLKRKAKLKDTGDILPGHGGILDRIDGILFAVPSGIILINYFY